MASAFSIVSVFSFFFFCCTQSTSVVKVFHFWRFFGLVASIIIFSSNFPVDIPIIFRRFLNIIFNIFAKLLLASAIRVGGALAGFSSILKNIVSFVVAVVKNNIVILFILLVSPTSYFHVAKIVINLKCYLNYNILLH